MEINNTFDHTSNRKVQSPSIEQSSFPSLTVMPLWSPGIRSFSFLFGIFDACRLALTTASSPLTMNVKCGGWWKWHSQVLRFHPFGISFSPFLSMQTSPRRAKRQSLRLKKQQQIPLKGHYLKSLISHKRKVMISQNSFCPLLNFHELMTHLLMLAVQAPLALPKFPTWGTSHLDCGIPFSVTPFGWHKKRPSTFIPFLNSQRMGRTVALCANMSTKCTWECTWPVILVGGGPGLGSPGGNTFLTYILVRSCIQLTCQSMLLSHPAPIHF